MRIHFKKGLTKSTKKFDNIGIKCYSFKCKKKEELVMATKITAKKPLTGNRRSHALNATKMKQKPNLQKKTINGEKVILSAREARTINKSNKTA